MDRYRDNLTMEALPMLRPELSMASHLPESWKGLGRLKMYRAAPPITENILAFIKYKIHKFICVLPSRTAKIQPKQLKQQIFFFEQFPQQLFFSYCDFFLVKCPLRKSCFSAFFSSSNGRAMILRFLWKDLELI